MVKFEYGDERKDKIVCQNAILYHLRLICGNDRKKQQDLLSKFSDNVLTFQTYLKGTVNQYVNSVQEGLTHLDENGFLHIHVIGNGNQEKEDENKILNHVTHECCHAFNHLLQQERSMYPKGIIKDGVFYYPSMGMIGTKDAKSMKPIRKGFYGDMFRESLMDIMTNVALVSFDENYMEQGINADTILKNPNTKRKVDSAMSRFDPLIQLAISAFSNDPSVSYKKLIDSGIGIYDYKVKKANGKEIMANDFLYGIMCDPFHIESEWNKCMSDKIPYQDLTEFIDTVYKSGVLQEKLPEANIKSIKLIIDQFSEFMNRKCKLNVQNGLCTQEEANRLISNYNSIYNEVIKIYGIGKIQNLNNNSIVRPTEIMDLGRREIEKRPGFISRGVEKVKAIFVFHKEKDKGDRN